MGASVLVHNDIISFGLSLTHLNQPRISSKPEENNVEFEHALFSGANSNMKIEHHKYGKPKCPNTPYYICSMQ